ncbi:MAG: ribosomal-processing cysteine protease Prp [Acutalibacteraceae bacterium]
MVKAEFYHNCNGLPVGFKFKGHSGHGSFGNDIVCSAVSSAAYLTANTITEIMKVSADARVSEDGEMTLKVPAESAQKTNDILLGLELHIKELQKQYPKNVTITTTEV